MDRAGGRHRLLRPSGPLHGRIEHADASTGEVCTVYDTSREPDATLLKACGNRRAAVCPSCSATYQADQFHLLAAGLKGGKGLPQTVAEHPRLFVTFTAPSFGPVHSRRAQGLLVYPCHPYRQGARCPHGLRAGCWQRHEPDDPRLGEPLCPRCYQAGAQVLWNALAGRLWSRTTIYLYRALAQLAGLSEAELRRLVRISFAKVAEYQRRGAVHFHAIIRLDAATDCGCPACVAPPAAGFTADLLEAAVRKAAAAVAVPCPPVEQDQGVTLMTRWGEQLDVRHITETGDENELSAEQVAGYAWLRRPFLDQEPPLLDHPGHPAVGPGRLRHPPTPRRHPATRRLGSPGRRQSRDRRCLLVLLRAGLSEHWGGVAGRLGGGSRSGGATSCPRGASHHDGRIAEAGSQGWTS